MVTATGHENQGVLLIVSGPSGVGKTTVCRRLAERLDALLSVSITTRPRRPGEVDGQAYSFVSREDFEERIRRGQVLEHAEVYGGHLYGTPAEPVNESLASGRDVILEIEINGAIQVKRRMPHAVGVYMLAPSPEDQKDRLMGRRQDSASAMAERLSKADGEIRYAQECGAYDLFVVNQDIDETVESLVRLVARTRAKAAGCSTQENVGR
ncbi:MAG TPA: guanylate kinase [Phycisphaerae bacterium]|nr:guanylate kinase [Phycisphaerae bacterium]